MIARISFVCSIWCRVLVRFVISFPPSRLLYAGEKCKTNARVLREENKGVTSRCNTAERVRRNTACQNRHVSSETRTSRDLLKPGDQVVDRRVSSLRVLVRYRPDQSPPALIEDRVHYSN